MLDTDNNEIKKIQIHNINNILLKSEDINNILHKYGIKKEINNLELWQKAFVHKSYALNNKKRIDSSDCASDTTDDLDNNINLDDYVNIQEESNERLEWLGDGIIQAITAAYLWKRFPKQDEGFLTKIRSKMVKTNSLSNLAKFIGLDKFILMSHHVEHECNGRNNPRILEDTFEAFIGAMYNEFDKNGKNYCGFPYCYKFFITLIESGGIDIPKLIMNDDNYKDRLMRYYQKEFNGKFPLYYDSPDENIGNKKFFTMCVNDINGKLVGTGTARSKKEAEQKAAKQALEFFGLINY